MTTPFKSGSRNVSPTPTPQEFDKGFQELFAAMDDLQERIRRVVAKEGPFELGNSDLFILGGAKMQLEGLLRSSGRTSPSETTCSAELDRKIYTCERNAAEWVDIGHAGEADQWVEMADFLRSLKGKSDVASTALPAGYLDAKLTGYHSVQVIFDSSKGAQDYLASLSANEQKRAFDRLEAAWGAYSVDSSDGEAARLEMERAMDQMLRAISVASHERTSGDGRLEAAYRARLTEILAALEFLDEGSGPNTAVGLAEKAAAEIKRLRSVAPTGEKHGIDKIVDLLAGMPPPSMKHYEPMDGEADLRDKPSTQKRRDGHSALRVKDGKMEVYDPHPSVSDAAVAWERAFRALPVLPPNAYEGFLAGAAWARTSTSAIERKRHCSHCATSWTAPVESCPTCTEPAIKFPVRLAGPDPEIGTDILDANDRNITFGAVEAILNTHGGNDGKA